MRHGGRNKRGGPNQPKPTRNTNIKALTISQPYASLIADGEKWVENRYWPTSYRGPLAIHAGKGTQYLDRKELAEYPHGCVIAVARLVACVHKDEVEVRDPLPCSQLHRAGIDRQTFLDHPHTEGPWCWVLKDVRKLVEPIPCRGQKGLWDAAVEMAELDSLFVEAQQEASE